MSGSVDQTAVEWVVFEVAGRYFGISSANVREIVRAVTLSAAPQAHPAVIGMLNLRGRVVAVFDLRRWLDLPDTPLEYQEQLIVTQAGEHWMALRADRALDLARLSPSDIEPAEAVVHDWSAIRGVAKMADRLVLLLEPRQLWSQQTAASPAEMPLPGTEVQA